LLADLVLALNDILSANELLTPMNRDVAKKAQAITAWLAENAYTLKKIAFVIDFVPPDNVLPELSRRLNFFPASPAGKFGSSG
jgi:hypothetical protein